MRKLLLWCPAIWVLGIVSLFYGLVLAPSRAHQERLLEDISASQFELQKLEQRRGNWHSASQIGAWPSDLLWRTESIEGAELGLQDQLVKLGQTQGLTFFSFGSATAHSELDKETVAVSLEGSASLTDFYTFLEEVEGLSPRVAFSTIRIRSAQHYGAQEGTVSVEFQLVAWSFWEALDA